MDDGGFGVLALRNIVVDKINIACIGANGTNEDYILNAENVINLDGYITPANAKLWVLDTASGNPNRTWEGPMIGYGNRGFTEAFGFGSNYDQHPTLDYAALTGRSGLYGGAASVQSAYLVDDASFAFASRGFTPGTGLALISSNGAYTEQGLIALGSGGVYVIGAHASHIFAASTTGSNLDTDGKINLWVAAGILNIKNRVGATRCFSVLILA
jgi:hypothetical protein